MKKKIVGIFVCTLLIATTYPVFSIEMNNEVISNKASPDYLPVKWKGLDQVQDINCGHGFFIGPPVLGAQEFKPSKDKLIGIELWIYRWMEPPSDLEITVSIRDSLNGSDLTVTTVSADQIETEEWVLFDFDDITVTPGNTYYIICSGGGSIEIGCFCWYFGINNPYKNGIAWRSWDDGANWSDLEDWNPEYPQIDLCFKTYHSKPRTKTFDINQLNWLFERFPNLFLILRHLIRQY